MRETKLLLSAGLLLLMALVVGSAAAAPASAAVEVPLSLADCVDLALENNPKTRAAYLAARSAEAGVAVARGSYLPTADLDVDVGTAGVGAGDGPTARPDIGVTGRLSVSYLIFDRTRRGTLDGARARLDAASLRHRAVLLDVALDVEEAWLALQGALWTRDAVEELVRQADWQRGLAAARHEVGLARRYDVVQAKATLREVEVQRTTAANQVTRARGNLGRAMGLPVREAPEIVPISEDMALKVLPPVERLLEDALTHRPSLGEAKAAVMEALADVRVARAGHLPTIAADASVAGSYETRPGLTAPWAVGVGLSLPLFRGLRTKHTIRGAEFDEARAQAALKARITDVQFEVWAAHTAALDAAAVVEATAALLDVALEAVTLAEEGYKAGTGSIGEVLDAQAGHAAARLGLLQARLDRLLSVTRVQRAVGRILAVESHSTIERLTR